MLTGEPPAVAPATGVEERVRRLIAETAGFRFDEGALLDAALDSLTLLAVVTRIEAAFAIELDSDEIVALFAARDAGAIATLVARKVAAAKAKLDESAGN
jgi:acyl carrier protein